MKRFSGFSIVELTVVILVIPILGTIGVSSTRYIIDNSRRESLKSALNQLQVANLSYYTKYSKYPLTSNTSFERLTDSEVLGPYLGKFNRNADSRFYYIVDDTNTIRYFVFCATINENELYCTGNGINSNTSLGGNIISEENIKIDSITCNQNCLTGYWNRISNSWEQNIIIGIDDPIEKEPIIKLPIFDLFQYIR